ncbi:MAG: phosphatase PAP2 family protein [Myxococcota bacterium]
MTLDLTRVEAKVSEELHHVAELVHDLPFNQRFRTITLASVAHAVFYFTANHYPLHEPWLLPMTRLDAAVPFLPWTVVPYLSAYALAFVGYLSLRRAENGLRFVQVFLTCVVVAGLTHWALPTRFPRELFPVPEDASAVSAFLLRVLRTFDAPSSCLPSLHVCISVVSALLVWRERRRLSLVLFAWAAVIAVSTLTTRQHFVVDVVTGIALAVLATVGVDLLRRRRAR